MDARRTRFVLFGWRRRRLSLYHKPRLKQQHPQRVVSEPQQQHAIHRYASTDRVFVHGDSERHIQHDHKGVHPIGDRGPDRCIKSDDFPRHDVKPVAEPDCEYNCTGGETNVADRPSVVSRVRGTRKMVHGFHVLHRSLMAMVHRFPERLTTNPEINLWSVSVRRVE